MGEVTFHTYMRDRARQANVPLQIISVKRGGRNQRSKTDRIMAAQGYFEQGRVFFRKRIDNFEDAVNEFCNLGRWTNDDIADAIAMFFEEDVKVLAPPPPSTGPAPTAYHPMPFEGGWRRAAFSQLNRPQTSVLGRIGQIPIDANGNVLCTPEQVEVFANRPDKQPQPAAFFKPMVR